MSNGRTVGHRRSSLGWLGFGAAASVAVSFAVSVAPIPAAAQGAVVGRVSIQERSGETTNDYNSTVIYLLPADSARADTPTTTPTRSAITMNGRAFVPRVRLVTPGSRVDFPNQDPFSHNIFSTNPGVMFDLGLYSSGKSKDARFQRPGAFPIYCNIHPRMTAFVVVIPSPWATQAGNDGRWTIPDVPAGKYVLHLWHERATATETPLDVPSAGLAGLASTIDARGFKAAPHKNKFGKEYAKTGKDRY